MTDLEKERERNLAETFGAAAAFSDYAVGDVICFRDRHSGNIYSGEIFWIAEAGSPGLSGNDALPMRYIVKRSGWSDSFSDIVYSFEIAGESDEPVLVKCKWCPGHHFKGQEQYCDRNPNKP